MVIVRLERNEYTPDKTFGYFYVNGKYVCLSLEDMVRKDAAGEGKIPGRTAIPAGRYKLNITWSHRFNKMTLEIVGVPNFTGCRCHAGNTEEDSEGCPLTGTTKDKEGVYDSRAALQKLWEAVLKALITDPDRQAWIEIVDTKEPLG
jgi:hypothetical protein